MAIPIKLMVTMCYEIFKASNWENSNAINILLIMGVRWPVVFKKYI